MEPLVARLADPWRWAAAAPASRPPRPDAAREQRGRHHALVAWVVGALSPTALDRGRRVPGPDAGERRCRHRLGHDRRSVSMALSTRRWSTYRRRTGRAAVRLGDLVVDVEGAVVRPGLVHVPGRWARGRCARPGWWLRRQRRPVTGTASELNLAQQVTDGLKVVVPGDRPGHRSGRSEAGGQQAEACGGRWTSRPQPRDGSRSSTRSRASDRRPSPRSSPRVQSRRSRAPRTSATRDIVGDAVFAEAEGPDHGRPLTRGAGSSHASRRLARSWVRSRPPCWPRSPGRAAGSPP